MQKNQVGDIFDGIEINESSRNINNSTKCLS